MFESVYITAAQVVTSMGFLDRLFKSKRPGDGDSQAGVPGAGVPAPIGQSPGVPPAPQAPQGPSRPVPTMVIRPRGPGMGTAGAPGQTGGGAIPRPGGPPPSPQPPTPPPGMPVQITQRISLRPGGAPPAAPASARPQKESQHFGLAPQPPGVPVPQAVPTVEADQSERLIFPLGMVLRSLPPEALSTDLGQLLARPAVASGTVSVPMDEVLRQLPTGVVQFAFNVLQAQIPSELLQPPDQLATHWERPVRLPLGEVVSRIPPDVMSRRSAPTREQMEYESIDAPFRAVPKGARGRRTSRVTPPPDALEEPALEPMVAQGPEPTSPPEFAQVPSDSLPLSEAMPFDAEGFQPFRKAVPAPPPPEMTPPVAMPPKAPVPSPMPPRPLLPSQSAPTMGMTGQISLSELDEEYDIQREPTQQLAKPPPGLIAVRPPATSALPFAMDDNTFMAPEAVGGETGKKPPVESKQDEESAGLGGLSALASLAAMADSEPLEPEEQTPEPPQPKAGPPSAEPEPPVEPEPPAAQGAEPEAEGGAWWEASAAAKEKRPEIEGPSAGAMPWQAMMQQEEPPLAEEAPPPETFAAPSMPVQTPPEPIEAPIAPPPEKPPAPAVAKNWWEMPLEESDFTSQAPAVPDIGPPPTTFKPTKPPVAESAPPKGFPPVFAPPITPQGQEPEAEEAIGEPPAIFPVKAAMRPEAAPGFIPPLSPVVPDLRRRGVSQGRPPEAAAPVMRRPEKPESIPVESPEVPAPTKPPVPRIAPRPPLARRPEPMPQHAAFAPTGPTPAPIEPPKPRKPVTLASAGRIGSQGRPKTVSPPTQPTRETEVISAPKQRSPMPIPRLRADRMSGLLSAASTWTPRPPTPLAARPINPRRILSRWLGLEAEREVPIQRVPSLLINSPHVKGAAIVDEEGLTLASQLPTGVSEQAVGALASRLFNQLKTAATEVGSQFSNQAIMTLGRWTVQITFEKPFYLVTLHDSPHFPPAVARRMRKIAGALVRQEFGG